MTHRVVVWGTGNVGRPALRAVAAHDELELAGRVERAEPEAARAAQPPGERGHGDPGARPRVVGVLGIPRRRAQRFHLLPERVAHLLQQPRFVDHLGPFESPGVGAAHDDAHPRQIDDRTDTAGGDQMAGAGTPDARGLALDGGRARCGGHEGDSGRRS